jgi:hypothetical protein
MYCCPQGVVRVRWLLAQLHGHHTGQR